MTQQRDDHIDNDSWRKRGRVACTACRQAKVRCDLSSIPCARCERLSIDCSVNKEFKRVNKRDKVHELEDSVQRLQSLVEQQQSWPQAPAQDQTTDVPARSDMLGSSSKAASQASPSLTTNYRPAMSNGTDRQDTQRQSPEVAVNGVRVIGNISLNEVEANELFRLYFERSHPFLPIVNADWTADECYDKSQLLFWTIIAISLRSRKHDPNLLLSLGPVLTTRLWSELGDGRHDGFRKGPIDMYDISCLLLLATWPLPGTRFWSDRSLLMCNMAMSSAMHLGFHRPAFSNEYTRDLKGVDHRLVCQRSSLWAANYALCTSFALDQGQVPLVPIEDGLVNRIKKHTLNYEIPLEIKHFAALQKTVLECFEVLFHMNNDDGDLNLVPDFYKHLESSERILINVQRLYGHEMSTMNGIRAQSNLLLIQSMYFVGDHTLECTKKGALRANSTASGLLSQLIDQVDADDFFGTAPYSLVQTLFRACFVILRVWFSSYSAGIDTSNTKILLNAACFVFRSISLNTKEADQPTRVANALKVVWSNFEKTPDMMRRPPILNIRSRYGANLAYDCLLYWRKVISNNPDQSTTGQDTGGATNRAPSIAPASSSLQKDSAASEINTTPTFEDFAAADLSWFDYLIDPTLFPEPS